MISKLINYSTASMYHIIVWPASRNFVMQLPFSKDLFDIFEIMRCVETVEVFMRLSSKYVNDQFFLGSKYL